MIKDKSILITGGAGTIGSELVRQLAPQNNKVYVVDTEETRMFDLVEELRLEGLDVQGRVVDICNFSALEEVVYDIGGFDYIFHCAARKHVTPMEDTPMEAVRVNIKGTDTIINLAKDSKAHLINISTDKVVNAESIMGATKKVAELMVKNAGYTSVRFGNVMGSRGSVIPFWQKQINEGKPLTVTDENARRYMMTVEEACSLVIEVIEMDDVRGKVVCLDLGKPVNILDLAKDILKKAGKKENIKMIGLRPGEQLEEKLMTMEEEKRAVKRGNCYVF